VLREERLAIHAGNEENVFSERVGERKASREARGITVPAQSLLGAVGADENQFSRARGHAELTQKGSERDPLPIGASHETLQSHPTVSCALERGSDAP
jgi:hypothetical protein